ncbi:MAG: transporter substrate-binding domain-containing protein [Alphaproteobacteria bacterium]|nr:transporter substrate-binding domain-containing protein [Alphaproteobacteria bacterium]
MKLLFSFVFSVLLSLSYIQNASAGSVVERIKQSGTIKCGVNTLANAYVEKTKEDLIGIDAEICKAISTAIIGNPFAIELIPANYGVGDNMLKQNKIDVLLGGNYWTAKRQITGGLMFPRPFYNSALAFLAHYKENSTSMRDYQGSKVCVLNDDFMIKALMDFSKKHNLDLHPMQIQTMERAKDLLFLHRCDLFISTLEILHSNYFKKAPKEIDLVVLPEIVRTYETGPVISSADTELFKIIQWLINGLITAEEEGITAQNIEDFENSKDPQVIALLSNNEKIASSLGVDKNWLSRTIATMGNYGEIIERGIGKKSPLRLNRGMNKLLKDGGNITAPDIAD